jgi:hypothetical protein
MSRILPGMMDALIKQPAVMAHMCETIFMSRCGHDISLLDNIEAVRGETFNFGSKER